MIHAVLWPRLVLGLVGFVVALRIYRRYSCHAREFALAGLNGEIALLYKIKCRTISMLALWMGLTTLSALNPTWPKDKGLIFLGIVMSLYIIFRSIGAVRELERLASLRLAQKRESSSCV